MNRNRRRKMRKLRPAPETPTQAQRQWTKEVILAELRRQTEAKNKRTGGD